MQEQVQVLQACARVAIDERGPFTVAIISQSKTLTLRAQPLITASWEYDGSSAWTFSLGTYHDAETNHHYRNYASLILSLNPAA